MEGNKEDTQKKNECPAGNDNTHSVLERFYGNGNLFQASRDIREKESTLNTTQSNNEDISKESECLVRENEAYSVLERFYEKRYLISSLGKL